MRLRAAVLGAAVALVAGLLVTSAAPTSVGARPQASTGPATIPPVGGRTPIVQDLFDDRPGSAMAWSGYIELSDGTELSYYLQLPGGCTAEAPCPALVEYSNYDPSNPAPMLPRDGDRQVARGYALLAVNARGTGCSSGDLEHPFMSEVEALDGAEVAEVLAAQPWVDGPVGMVGSSGAGMSQIHVAGTNPPNLGAITPGGAFGDYWDGVSPGGIPTDYLTYWSVLVYALNAPDEHDVSDRAQRVADLLGVRDDAGLPYVVDSSNLAEVLDGVEEALPPVRPLVETGPWYATDPPPGCDDNIAGREVVDAVALAAADPWQSEGDLWAEAAPRNALARTTVPTLIMDGLQDGHEEIGPDRLFGESGAWPQPGPGPDGALIRLVTGDGPHEFPQESPAALAEQDAFLDLLVADRVPGPTTEVAGASTVDRSCNPPYLGALDDVADAIDALWSAPPVVVHTDRGPDAAVTSDDPCTGARFRSSFAQWPPTPTSTSTLLLGSDGALGGSSATSPGSTAFEAVRGEPGTVGLIEPLSILPAASDRAIFETAPFVTAQNFGGPASVDLWIASDEPIVDLEVSLAEVSAGGEESVIESGWRRTSLRPLGVDDDPLRPTLDRSQPGCGSVGTPSCTLASPTNVRIAIPSFVRTVAAGSRLRLMISGPGYRPSVMRFPAAHEASVEIYHDVDRPSKVVVGTLPPPTSLRPIDWVRVTPDPRDGESVAPGSEAVRIDWQTKNDLDADAYLVARNGVPEEVVDVDDPAFGYPFLSARIFVPVGNPGLVTVTPIVDGATTTSSAPAPSPLPLSSLLAENLLTDGLSDFEGGSSSWLALNGLTAAATTSQAHSGSASLELEGAWPGTALVYGGAVNAVCPGDLLRLEGWVRAGDDDTTLALALAFMGSTPGDPLSVAAEVVDLEGGSATWERIIVTTTAPPGALAVAPSVASRDLAGSPTVYLDDVVLQRSSTATSCG
jgi:predicted acyl esterase